MAIKTHGVGNGKVLSRSGYGRLSINAKDLKAHRFSYLLATGDEPEMVRHICGNRKCVRPNHLRAGGSEENLIDFSLIVESKLEFCCSAGCNL